VSTVVLVLALGGPLTLGVLVHRFGAREPRFPSRPLTAIVLGARVTPAGLPSPALEDRVRVGVELLQRGHAERLVLSGGTPDGRPTEASVMRQLALSLGAREEQLVLEPHSRSTFENARHCAALLAPDEPVLVVSCDFHLARATAHFRAHRRTVWPVPSTRSLRAADRLMVTSKEVIALLRRPWLLWRLATVAAPRT
jgi:uncharacterized SAM-binding protein YcdF (DUF218 family)